MTSRAGRVVVGVDDTVTGWAALRTALALARQRSATLYAVRVLPAAGNGPPTAPAILQRDLVTMAQDLVRGAFVRAFGATPTGSDIQIAIADGPVGPGLVRLADQDSDLLVLGARRRHRGFGHQPVRYCTSHARCPVLVVPAPELARQGSARSLTKELSRYIDRLAVGTDHSMLA